MNTNYDNIFGFNGFRIDSRDGVLLIYRVSEARQRALNYLIENGHDYALAADMVRSGHARAFYGTDLEFLDHLYEVGLIGSCMFLTRCGASVSSDSEFLHEHDSSTYTQLGKELVRLGIIRGDYASEERGWIVWGLAGGPVPSALLDGDDQMVAVFPVDDTLLPEFSTVAVASLHGDAATRKMVRAHELRRAAGI